MSEKQRIRGFEPVIDVHRQNFSTQGSKHFKHFVVMPDESVKFFSDVKLPTRSDPRSAGYDFYLASDLRLLPQQKTIIWTDVKAYMQEDEVLQLHLRSSVGHKLGLLLTNSTGIIDSSYYSNEGNDGNIGIAVVNTTGLTVEMKAGDRIAQGIFMKYLITDDDEVTSAERVGGFGSSGE